MREIFNAVFLIAGSAFILWLLFYLFYFAFRRDNKNSRIMEEKKEIPVKSLK
jgi:hypothetical protein